eukprot:gene16893-biopygen12326
MSSIPCSTLCHLSVEGAGRRMQSTGGRAEDDAGVETGSERKARKDRAPREVTEGSEWRGAGGTSLEADAGR